MKRIISTLLAVAMLFTLSCSAFAIGVENQSSEKQDKIDEIFKELNELALDANVKNCATYGAVQSEEQMNFKNERKRTLDSQLESLGVHKIDPDCKEDLEHLGNVMLGAIDASTLNDGLCAMAIEDPPNLAILTRNYSVYQYDDSIYTDKIYNCSYVVVVDDKGYGGLTNITVDVGLCGKTSLLLSDLAKYNFNFGFSQFVGSMPYGWVANWFIGSVFTALDSYDGNSIVTCPRGHSGIYTMNMASVTQMTYYYVYDPGYQTWVLCGSRASNLSFSRTDCLAANIGGRSLTSSYDFPETSSRTGQSAGWYFLQYVENRESNHHAPGSFTINGMNGYSTKFTPVYYSTPIYLI